MRIKDSNLSVEAITSMLADLISKMQSYDIEQTVYLRIQGIQVTAPLTLGKLTLERCDDNYAETEIQSIAQKFNLKKDNEESFERIVANDFRSELKNHCVAKFKVIAEPARAFERAKDEARRVIDILRFTSKTLYNFSEDIRIGLDGDHPRAERRGFVSSCDGVIVTGDTVGSFRPLIIDEDAIEHMKETGAMSLVAFLTIERPSKFQESLLRSVHWLSSAITQSEHENKYLHLIIALETLFTPPKGEPIANTIAESTALIINNTLPGRKQIKKSIKLAYGARSIIAHGGKKPITDSDYYTLLIYVINVLMTLIKKHEEFKDPQELINYLEDKKFS
ncbi:hypothetical protein [Pseudomonas sp. AM4(2022)]|uniref:hypothetical protein n=1 Tax=Pseudomonas sp. AM4(2022) TaxID=2983408 RepID=UPI002E82187C|nr:hypothetical protein [Pseudomonas sp. AM4(2022)]